VPHSTIARDSKMPTIVARYWTLPVLNEKTGLYGPTNKMADNVRPSMHGGTAS